MRRFLVPVLLLAGLGLAQENYTTNWSGHRTFHVNTLANSQTSTVITANVVKYPMLVRLGPADAAIFAAAKTTGADIRFTKSNNTTRLQHAIETWDATNNLGAVWVLLDTVYANDQAQNFRMHWGNASAVDSSKSAAVFDTANGFVAVWHMDGATNNLVDATVNAFTGTAVGNANTDNPQITSVAGVIGKGQDFPASTNNDNTGGGYRINGTSTGALNFPDSGRYTLSAWINQQSNNQFRTIIGKGDNQYAMHSNGTTLEFFQYASIPPGGAWQAVGLAGGSALNNWLHIVGIRNGPSSILYINGVMVDSTYTNAANGAARIDTANVYIGKWGGNASTQPTSNDRFFDGILDEIRVSKVVRSADWNLLDFASQNAAQSLVTDSTVPVIRYAVDSIVAEVGVPIANQLPVVLSGVPQPTVAISPALPAGLTFTTNNTNRGMISGNPTATQGRTMHVITATNSKGSFSDTIYVTVNANTESYANWTNVKTLTFNSPATETVTQYPFLLRLGAADSAVFANAGANGASLRFSRTDAIKLKYSIEQWNAVNRSAVVWVLMDQVTAGANTLRMHWGNGSATSQSSSQAVFSRTNGSVGVWHMGDASGAAARPNAVQPGVNDAVPGGSETATLLPITGVIGMADSLRAQGALATTKVTDDHFYLGNGIRFPNYQMSMSMWIKLPATIPDGWNHWMGFGNVAASDNVWFGRVGSNNNWKARGAANGSESNNDGALVVTDGLNPRPAWAHFAITRSGNLGRRWTMHKNGVKLIDYTGLANNHDLLTTVRDSNFIGRALWGDPNTRAAIDEARVDNVARSAAWYQLDYATQRPGASPVSNLSYATVSGTPGAAITPRAPVLSGTAVNYTLSGTLPAGIVFNDTTGVFSGTPAAASSANVMVTANSGVWSTSAPVTLNFGGPDGAYATAWSGHKYVSVNATTAGVTSGTAVKFPLLIKLGTADSAIFNASQANGGDIRFTKLDNTTRLKHEIDTWDKANKRAAVWVLVDTVYGGSTGSRLRMHYGNAGVADSSNGKAVFDSANGYIGVYHMGNPSGDPQTGVRPNSARGGANPATPVNFPAATLVRTGMIGQSDTLMGGTRAAGAYLNYGTLPASVFTANGAATLSAWVRFGAFGPVAAPANAWVQFLTFGNTGTNNNGNDAMWIGKTADNATNGQSGVAGTNRVAAQNIAGTTNTLPTFGTDNSLALNEWTLVSFTVSGANHIVYRNGVAVGSRTDGAGLTAVARTANYIGRGTWNADSNFNGALDEARISNVARSADWLKLEYANQNASQNLVALTDNQVNIVTGVNNASALLLNGPALNFKAMGKGLLFQVRGEASAKVRIAVIDMFGRTVWNRTETVGAGMKQIVWNGHANNGEGIGSGIYVVRMNLLDAKGLTEKSLTRKVPLTN
jgi:hypothetical protein